MSAMFLLQFAIVLLCIFVGARVGGIGLGVFGGLGLAILSFGFGLKPAGLPIDVMFMIMAVVAAAAAMQAAGGLDYMIKIATKILRRNPKHITFIAPAVTWLFTFLAGTGHVAYSVLPVIAEVSRQNGIRPERPMAASSVASQLAITSSPLSAAVVFYLGKITAMPGFEHISLLDIICVTVPATLAGTIALSLYSMRRGKELEQDPEYQRRLQDPVWRERILNTTSTTLNEALPQGAKKSVYLFLLALVVIVAIAMIPEIRTIGSGKAISMSLIIQMMMLCFGGVILLATKTNPQIVPNGVVFKSGMVAAIAIYGIAWMSDTYFQYAMPEFKAAITDMVQTYPWTFALALFAVSVVINSQAATAVMLLPVGIGLGIPAPILVGLMPATYAYFFIPNYPSDIATVNFDVTGTTKIGKYYFNHSFMVPGLIGVVVACLVGVSVAELVIR